MLNAFTDDERAKLLGIEEGAQANINPARLCTYLPVASPYTTPTFVAGTPTKIVPGSTVKTKHKFTLDVPNTRYYLDDPGAVGKWFEVIATTSMSSSSSNHLVTAEIYINGAFKEGLGIERWIAAGADTGALGLSGSFQLSHGNYVELYVTDSSNGTVTLSRLAINIFEMSGAS